MHDAAISARPPSRVISEPETGAIRIRNFSHERPLHTSGAAGKLVDVPEADIRLLPRVAIAQAAAAFDSASMNESRSLLIKSACVVGIPWGKPG